MRIALFGLTAVVLTCAGSAAQEVKKKDDKSPNMGSATKEVTEIAGKNLDAWIKEISHKDPSRRALAMRMVMGFGPQKAQKAAPAIYDELKKHKLATPIDVSVRIDGCIALSTILTGVNDPDPKLLVDAVKIIGRFCKDEQVIVKTRAAQSLARFGTKGHESVIDVVAVAQELSGWEARQAGLQCLIVLTKYDPEPSETVLRAFYKGLHDNSMQVKITSAQSLAQFREIRSTHLEYPRLIRNLSDATKDIEPQVQIWAHLALMTVKLDPKKPAAGPEHLSAIAKHLKHPDPIVKVLAANALGQIGKLAHPEWPRVAAALTDPDLDVVLACIIALTQMEAVEAVPALEGLSDSPTMHAHIRQAARHAVEVIKYGKRPVTPTTPTPVNGTK
jgi:HEAT repeats